MIQPMEARLPRTLDSLGRLFDFVSDFVAENHIDEASAYAISLAVEEIFVNMVRYNSGSTESVAVSLSRDADRVVVKLTDSGVRPFDPTKAAPIDTGLPLGARQPGGLGIHLARSVMDEIGYEYDDGRSTTTLIKRLGATRV
jgi:serine/threonine-protein kinase RsbW